VYPRYSRALSQIGYALAVEKETLASIVKGSGMTAEDNATPGKKHYTYSVDGKEYTTTDSSLTGAQIKARIPDFNPSFQLVLEGRGGQPDKVIGSDDSVDLNVHPPCRFYTVPPATFGLR
jgi:multiubiquitin